MNQFQLGTGNMGKICCGSEEEQGGKSEGIIRDLPRF